MRVVFAHQSVGNDILDGVRTLASEAGVNLNIVESRDAGALEKGFSHFKIGRNGDPTGKLEEYRRALSNLGQTDVDVALVKLCYVDVTAATDATQLAERYTETIKELQGRHSHTKFVATTVPLTTVQRGPKAWIKQRLGRTPAGYIENAKREEFNDVLRQRFEPSSLLDIAHIEAHSGGRPTVFTYEGRTINALNPRLTSDGGHLNNTGKRVVGAAFVKFLADARAN
jgi:hypothetical protein